MTEERAEAELSRSPLMCCYYSTDDCLGVSLRFSKTISFCHRLPSALLCIPMDLVHLLCPNSTGVSLTSLSLSLLITAPVFSAPIHLRMMYHCLGLHAMPLFFKFRLSLGLRNRTVHLVYLFQLGNRALCFFACTALPADRLPSKMQESTKTLQSKIKHLGMMIPGHDHGCTCATCY